MSEPMLDGQSDGVMSECHFQCQLVNMHQEYANVYLGHFTLVWFANEIDGVWSRQILYFPLWKRISIIIDFSSAYNDGPIRGWSFSFNSKAKSHWNQKKKTPFKPRLKFTMFK